MGVLYIQFMILGRYSWRMCYRNKHRIWKTHWY